MSGSKFKFLALGGVALAAIGCAATAVLAHPPLPPARAGECFAEVVRPPAYRTVTETVPGAPVVSYRDIPAVLGHGTRQVLAVPARIDRQVIPATYKTVPRWSLVPGQAHWVKDRPVWRVVTERRLVAPAHLEWREGSAARGFSSASGPGGYGVHVRPTGEVQCRVVVPARYALVTRRVLVSPGGFHRVIGPPRKVICYDRVIATPARVIEHRIPAQYRTIEITYVIHPAHKERVVTPGPARQITRQVIAAPAQRGWAPIHCAEAHHPMPPAPQPQPRGRAYAPNALLAPATPVPDPQPTPRGYGAAPRAYPPTVSDRQTFNLPPLVPAPYDTGHPAPGR